MSVWSLYDISVIVTCRLRSATVSSATRDARGVDLGPMPSKACTCLSQAKSHKAPTLTEIQIRGCCCHCKCAITVPSNPQSLLQNALEAITLLSELKAARHPMRALPPLSHIWPAERRSDPCPGHAGTVAVKPLVAHAVTIGIVGGGQRHSSQRPPV